jgi:hypothetical protein
MSASKWKEENACIIDVDKTGSKWFIDKDGYCPSGRTGNELKLYMPFIPLVNLKPPNIHRKY